MESLTHANTSFLEEKETEFNLITVLVPQFYAGSTQTPMVFFREFDNFSLSTDVE